MMYLLMIVMLGCGYYTFTFGISQWKKNNKLGGVSTMILAVFGTLIPIVVMYIKNS